MFGDLKKKTGLVRRLFRASTMVLYDYKDLPSFKKRMNTLFVSYAKREVQNWRKYLNATRKA
jgi:hypothetical protein